MVTIEADARSLQVTARDWFGATPWLVAQATVDRDTNQLHGFKKPVITSVQTSADGDCLAFAGTALQQARYESVTGEVRIAFAARRCRR